MPILDIDLTNVETSNGFDLLPKGRYTAMVVDTVLKPTKAGTGEYLEITLEIIDGNGRGRKVWDRLNIRNQNKKAEDISQQQLKALAKACGQSITPGFNTDMLHNVPVTIELDIEEREGWDPQNRVKNYIAANGQSAPVSAPRQAPKAEVITSSPAAQVANTTAVWKKKSTATA
jgi:hypothetical protein